MQYKGMPYKGPFACAALAFCTYVTWKLMSVANRMQRSHAAFLTQPAPAPPDDNTPSDFGRHAASVLRNANDVTIRTCEAILGVDLANEVREWGAAHPVALSKGEVDLRTIVSNYSERRLDKLPELFSQVVDLFVKAVGRQAFDDALSILQFYPNLLKARQTAPPGHTCTAEIVPFSAQMLQALYTLTLHVLAQPRWTFFPNDIRTLADVLRQATLDSLALRVASLTVRDLATEPLVVHPSVLHWGTVTPFDSAYVKWLVTDLVTVVRSTDVFARAASLSYNLTENADTQDFRAQVAKLITEMRPRSGLAADGEDTPAPVPPVTADMIQLHPVNDPCFLCFGSQHRRWCPRRLFGDASPHARAFIVHADVPSIPGKGSSGSRLVLIFFTGSDRKSVWPQVNVWAGMVPLKSDYGNLAGDKPHVHNGFQSHHQALWPTIRQRLQDLGRDLKTPMQVVVVGHSLGGALTVLTGLALAHAKSQRDVNVSSIVLATAACPLTLDAAGAKLFKRSVPGPHYDFVHVVDPVPLLDWSGLGCRTAIPILLQRQDGQSELSAWRMLLSTLTNHDKDLYAELSVPGSLALLDVKPPNAEGLRGDGGDAAE